ncbi:MAG TPA: hypothetical protein VMB27_04935 [Solirubrobacteraceae bacterium]|nr:hypothetical protein [Solirubrobacteraceae bacterium]
MIKTEDRATVQSPASSTSGQVTRLVSELERLLREPGCPACSYVGEIERSFFSWFQIESFSSPQVQGRLRAALGMCPPHSRRLVEELGGGHIMTTVVREALAGALHHVRGDTQTGTCPACEAVEAGSRRGCRLVLDGLLEPAMTRLYSDHGGMCLVHVLQSLPVVDPPTLTLLTERLLARLREPEGPGLPTVLAGSDDDARRRALWREKLPAIPHNGSTIDRLREIIEIDACPVCLSAGVAERDYLDWFSTRSAAGDDSLGSDPGEFCPGHLHDIAHAHTTRSPGLAIDHKRAARIAQLERFLARLSNLPAPSKRGRRSKPDALDHVRAELLATPYCAVCNARDGAERARLDLVTASLALASVRDRYDRSHGLCARHAMQMADGHAARAARRHLDGRLAVLAWEVSETARKYGWAYRHETSGPEHDAWARALAQIDGRVFVGAPAPLPADQVPDSPQPQ